MGPAANFEPDYCLPLKQFMKRYLFSALLSVLVVSIGLMAGCRRNSDSSTTPTNPIPCRLASYTSALTFNGPPAASLQSNFTITYNDSSNFLISLQGTEQGQSYNVTFTYGTNRQLNSISTGGTVIRQVIYSVNGRLVNQVNNTVDRSYEVLAYDASSRLVSVRKFNQGGQLIARRSFVYSGPGSNISADSSFTVNPTTGVNTLVQALFYTNYDNNRNPLKLLGASVYSNNLDIISIVTGCEPTTDNNPGNITWLLPSGSGTINLAATPTYRYNSYGNIGNVAAAGAAPLLQGTNNVGSYNATYTFGSGCQ
jgi:hypothetical protein